MNVSSRTPEGEFNHCPVCRQNIRITPSEGTGDAPCPNCGVLLWFIKTVHSFAYFDRSQWPATLFGHPDFRIAARELENSTCDVEFFEVGHQVRITGGEFRSFVGTIQAIECLELGKVTVIVEIFGRATPVDVEIRHLTAV